MANKRSETVIKKSRNRYRIYKRISYLILAGLVAIGFTICWFIKPQKVVTETVETVKTVEVPVYEEEGLPVVNEVDYFNVPLSHSLQKFIYEVAADEEVPVSLVIAMIDSESQFDPEVVSQTDDTGLMQINEVNFFHLAQDYHCADMTDPYQNVFCGIKIIGSYLKKYDNDVTKALMCYNLGEYGANKAWENGIFCTEYTNDVETKWEVYKEYGSSDETR